MPLVQYVMQKMMRQAEGNLHDINHFLKVWGLSRTIGGLEGLDADSLQILELAAIIHDISCPLCRKKYGSAYGKKQELESPALVREFIQEFHLDSAVSQRIENIVSHHHTYQNVADPALQILIEADFLVNADEGRLSPKGIASFRRKVFRTKSGLALMDLMYPPTP